MKVAILMGSEKDRITMEAAADVLADIGIEHDVHVMSAHRTPERVAAYAAVDEIEFAGMQMRSDIGA